MKWRDIFGWGVAGVLILIMAAVIGGYLFLKSNRFQQIAIPKITQAADQASGGKTEIRALDFSLRTLTVHLYDITVHGTEKAVQQPLLQVDNLTVGIKIESILQRKFKLTELVIAHPVAYVRMNRDGSSNFPLPVSGSASSPKSNIFDLGVSHVQILSGEIK